jgi:hypothetical protein
MTRKVRIRKKRKMKSSKFNRARYIKGGMGMISKMAAKFVPEDKLKEGMDKAKDFIPDKKGAQPTSEEPDKPETK